MNRKVLFFAIPIFVLVVSLTGCVPSPPQTVREPIIFSQASASLVMMDLDDLTLSADLIVIGTFDSIPPSRWNTQDGKLPENITRETIWKERLFIYTEQVFQPNLILKADPQEREILVRSFGGQVGQDIMEMSNSDIAYTAGQEYLLFLSYYPDKIEDGTPGYYVASGSIQGVYKIVDRTAISSRDEWALDELVTYIQALVLSKVDLPDTPEAKEIMHQIETAYAIEAGCSFDYSIFPSIYMNDPRYPVEGKQLESIRVATDNPSLESAGYLDYKLAYYPWWLEGRRRWKEIYNRAKAENREISEEEMQAFQASKWGTYPGGSCFPDKPSQIGIRFVSIRFENDIATVVLSYCGPKKLILVLVDEYWFIAQEKTYSLKRCENKN